MKENENQEKPGLKVDAVMKEVMEEQKAVLLAKISEYVEDKTKIGEIQEIINNAMDSAFRFGEMSETAATKGDEIIASMGNFFNNYLNPANSKYKQLYDNQRLATAALLQTVQILQLQLGVNEEISNPTLDILSLIGTAASLSKGKSGRQDCYRKRQQGIKR